MLCRRPLGRLEGPEESLCSSDGYNKIRNDLQHQKVPVIVVRQLNRPDEGISQAAIALG